MAESTHTFTNLPVGLALPILEVSALAQKLPAKNGF
jgi:hypothetical protein